MKKSLTLLALSLLLSPSLYAAKSSKQLSQACSGANFEQVTLRPGCSTTCYEEPCKVYFQIPRGKGKYQVFEGRFNIGHFRAGRRVFLGNFWKGNHRFSIPDAGVPDTYLFVGGRDN